MASKEQLLDHLHRVVKVVRSGLLKRALHSVDEAPPLVFWRMIYGDLLDVAVLEWCKLFGTDSEPTHWKKLVEDPIVFRGELLNALGMDDAQWTEYRAEMKAYRDSRVSHHFEEPSVTRYPGLEIALNSCYFYYRYLIAALRALGEDRFPDDLREYGANFSAQSRHIAAVALGATRDIVDHVL